MKKVPLILGIGCFLCAVSGGLLLLKQFHRYGFSNFENWYMLLVVVAIFLLTFYLIRESIKKKDSIFE